MRKPKQLILPIACVMSIAFCAMLLLQSADIVRPFGVGWGDKIRATAYSFGFDGSILFQSLSGEKAPPASYGGSALSFVGKRNDFAGVHYHRLNLVCLAPDRTPRPGVFATQTELRINLIWPALISLALILLCALRAVQDRRAAADGHRCRNCGYDLRATPDRCPECGLVQSEEHS